MLRVADWIMSRLAIEGVRHIFMLPGGGAMHLNDALACETRITPIPCHHEQACGISAEAYGRTGNQDNPGFGVALVTTGPGATNLITPVAGAWIDSIPMLVISGQVKRQDMLRGRPLRQGGVQEVNILSIVSEITKYSATINDPLEVRDKLETALYKMKSGRPGPVWIEVPLDVQGAQINPKTLPAPCFSDSPAPSPKSSQIKKILTLLEQSNRPLILAGHGVRLANASSEFVELVEKWKIPVVCTWNALDLLPHEHPLYVGSPGVVALRAPNFAIQNCDLLISIGCRLDNVITAYNPENFAKNALKVAVDIDINELNNHKIDLTEKIQANAANFIRALNSSNLNTFHDRLAWREQCMSWKKRYSVNDGQPFGEVAPISHYQFVDTLSEVLPENILISTGSSGLAIEAFYSAFRSKLNQRIFLTSGLGSMGYGLAASIGACLGNNSRLTVAIESDGSLMLNLQELATLKALNLPLKLIIMDNNGYASIRNTQRNYFDSRFIATGPNSGLYIPDLAEVSQSIGLRTVCIDSPKQLASSLKEFLISPGPAVCIVSLKTDELLQPKVSALPQLDGSMLSMPLEDMTPLLPLDKLEAEMSFKLSHESYTARLHK